jgi:hypothetical protein
VGGYASFVGTLENGRMFVNLIASLHGDEMIGAERLGHDGGVGPEPPLHGARVPSPTCVSPTTHAITRSQLGEGGTGGSPPPSNLFR